MSATYIQGLIEDIRNQTQQFGNTRQGVADLLTLINQEKLDYNGVKSVIEEITNIAPEFFEYLQSEDITEAITKIVVEKISTGISGTITPEMTLDELNYLDPPANTQPRPNGLYRASKDNATYANGLVARPNVLTTFKKTGTTWVIDSEVEMPKVNVINNTDSTLTTDASSANVARLMKLRGIVVSDWDVTQMTTYTYVRSTGLLSQTGTTEIKLKNGSNLIISAFSNLQVVGSGVAVNGKSFLYIDFDTPTTASNIVSTISVSPTASLPVLADGKSRIVLGYSQLITGTNADLVIEKLGLFFGSTANNKKPIQTIKETADSASANVFKLKNDLQSNEGYISGSATVMFDPSSGLLNATTPQRYINANGVSGFIVSASGVSGSLMTNFETVPSSASNDDVYVVFSDFDIPLSGTQFMLNTAKFGSLPTVPIGKQRVILGYAKKISSIQYDFYSSLFGIYQESGNRKKPFQVKLDAAGGSVITNRQKVERVWKNDFPNVLTKAPKFVQKLLLQQEDVNIVLLGDSLFALQSGCSNSPTHPQGLPNGCYQQHVQWWLWDFIVKNKPITNRWEITPNVFTYSGTWSIANSKFDSPGWSGEFRSYIANIHQSNTANASVGFTWDLAAFEKLNWIYKKTLDGANLVTLNIAEGNGKVQVYNGIAWVEANGYTFTQKTAYQGSDSASSGGSGYSVHLSDQKIKMRRVAASGSVTLTFSKDSSTSEYLYFWGTERWNGAAVFITNVARGGRHISLLRDNFMNDVVERKPDLVLFELPLTNEYSQFSQTGYAQIIDHVQDFVWGDRTGAVNSLNLKTQSNNWNDFEVLLILPHYRQYYFKGNIPANYKLSGSNLDIITYDGDSTPYTTSQKIKALIKQKSDLNYIDMGDVFISEAKNLGWTTEQASTTSGITSDLSFTNDTVHQNDFGAYIWGRVLGGILGNI